MKIINSAISHLQALLNPQEKVPEDYLSIKQWRDKWGVGDTTARRTIERLYMSGIMDEPKILKIKSIFGRQHTDTMHFRIKKEYVSKIAKPVKKKS